MDAHYIFTSERLGFRNWKDSDLEKMILINSDKNVMKFFPFVPSTAQTKKFIQRMQKQFARKGYCYFAVDLLETNLFIGFIGLSEQTYPANFTPCTDIGWRLNKDHWNKGLATEGAIACLKYAQQNLGLAKIYAVASLVNNNSIKVMEKAGMQFEEIFDHPNLIGDKRLKTCVLYCKKLN
jgi:RimJ/RimL family protein N-acetyltransferase